MIEDLQAISDAECAGATLCLCGGSDTAWAVFAPGIWMSAAATCEDYKPSPASVHAGAGGKRLFM